MRLDELTSMPNDGGCQYSLNKIPTAVIRRRVSRTNFALAGVYSKQYREAFLPEVIVMSQYVTDSMFVHRMH